MRLAALARASVSLTSRPCSSCAGRPHRRRRHERISAHRRQRRDVAADRERAARARERRPRQRRRRGEPGAAKSVVLAIDTLAVDGRASLRDAAAAAHAFVDAKAAADRVSVIVVRAHRRAADRLLGDERRRRQRPQPALSVDRTPGTALYDAIVAAAHSLAGSSEGRPRDHRPHRRPGRLEQLRPSRRRSTRRAGRARSCLSDRDRGRDFDPAPLRTIAGQTGGSYHGVGSTQRAAAGVRVDRRGALSERGASATTRPRAPATSVRLDVDARGAGAAQSSFDVPASFGTSAGAKPVEPARSASTRRSARSCSGCIVGFLVLCAICFDRPPPPRQLGEGAACASRRADAAARGPERAALVPEGALQGNRGSVRAAFAVAPDRADAHSRRRAVARGRVRLDRLGGAVIGGFFCSAPARRVR